MKRILLNLLLLLPTITFCQLGKTTDEIESSLGKNYNVESIGNFTKYNYVFDYENGDKQTYTFTFDHFGYCINWSLTRPLDKDNLSYQELETHFKENDLVYLDTVDKSTMNVNLFRYEDLYEVYVSNKN